MSKKQDDDNIKTETEFVLTFIKYVFTFPFILILFLAGKRSAKELFSFFYYAFDFLDDAIMTYYLIWANIIMFILEIFIFIPLGWMDYLVISPENFYSGNLLSLVTHMFLHASFMHLFGNMLFLFVFGRIVEKYLGKNQMLIIYFGAGLISASIDSGIFFGGGLGASAAISGLVAAAILIRPFYFSYIAFFPLPVFVLGILQIMGDFTSVLNPDPESNVGYLAHLLGYASVMITVFLLNKEERKKMFYGLLINLIIITVLIGLGIA
jgi:membrane associated rhomboid family serine protease